MAFTITNILNDLGSLHCVQTDATSTVDVLKASSGRLYKIEIDNSANDAPSYVRLWDSTGSITVGSTGPNWVFKCPASVLRSFSCPAGSIFSAGLKAACVTTAGTAGNTNPTNDVIYRIQLS